VVSFGEHFLDLFDYGHEIHGRLNDPRLEHFEFRFKSLLKIFDGCFVLLTCFYSLGISFWLGASGVGGTSRDRFIDLLDGF